MTSPALLRLEGVGKDYPVHGRGWPARQQRLKAVDRVSLAVRPGETLGLVGESGCGKTTLGKLITRLEEADRGEIFFRGEKLHRLAGEELRRQRRHFQPVFQDPFASLNPRMTVSQTLAEPLLIHGLARGRGRIRELLALVGLDDGFLARYPHQLSGGQRQRVVIARALAIQPDLVVADEPVSSLDVSVQAQILNLLLELQCRLHLTMVFISHDLRVISLLADTVAVMYVGRIMEMAPTAALYETPCHPYTMALFNALPRLIPGRHRQRALLQGEPASPIAPAPGCRFQGRCPYRAPECTAYENALLPAGPGHTVACCRWETVKNADNNIR